MRKKQYILDLEKVEINKKEIEKRRGKKWKALELLKELEGKEEFEKDLFGTLISDYQAILKSTQDEDVIKLVKEGIRNASECYRKALRRRFSIEVQWATPDIFTQAPILEGRVPMNSTIYRELKEDIERKGIIEPLLATDSYEIIDGWHRCKIAQELGIDKIPYKVINLKTIPENLKQRIIFDLGVGNNLLRRQLSIEDKKKLTRQWSTFHRKRPTPGRPTEEEVELSRELREKGLENMSEMHRHIAISFGLVTE